MLNLNLKEYIESGILELFVCSALMEEEMAEVSRLILIYPLLLNEVQKIENAFIQIAGNNDKWRSNLELKIKQTQ